MGGIQKRVQDFWFSLFLFAFFCNNIALSLLFLIFCRIQALIRIERPYFRKLKFCRKKKKGGYTK